MKSKFMFYFLEEKTFKILLYSNKNNKKKPAPLNFLYIKIN